MGLCCILQQATGQGADFQTYSKFDFIPGSQIVFFDDFSNESIGDFPASWLSNASGEVVSTSFLQGKWFKMNTSGNFFINEGLKVSENFTLEFDLFLTREGENGDNFTISLLVTDEDDLYPNLMGSGKSGIEVELVTVESGNDGFSYRAFDSASNSSFSGSYSKEEDQLLFNKVYRVSIWVQKTRLRMYVDQTKVFDVQRAFPRGAIVDQVRLSTNYEAFLHISNFRVANAGDDTRSQLLTSGKLVSYGIYFDLGKDVVKPTSYGAIKEIATILQENPTLRIKIVGHTDSDGDDKLNLDLSKRRSGNVKKVLADEFKIDPSRIETDGMGESEPLAPNTNTENKAKNRRVEFLKI
jgi:OOP family OmpA-OmpF porin